MTIPASGTTIFYSNLQDDDRELLPFSGWFSAYQSFSHPRIDEVHLKALNSICLQA